MRIHDLGLRIALSIVARRLDPACPAGVQAVRQPGSEQDLRRALHAQMLRNVPQSRRCLHDRVSSHRDCRTWTRACRTAVRAILREINLLVAYAHIG